MPSAIPVHCLVYVTDFSGFTVMMPRVWNPDPSRYKGARRRLVEALLADIRTHLGEGRQRSLAWYSTQVCGQHSGYLHQFLELNKPHELSEKARKGLSQHLDIPEANLMDTDLSQVVKGNIRGSTNTLSQNELPVKGRAAPGSDKIAWEGGVVVGHIERHVSVLRSPEGFAIMVNGSSMEPRFFAGDFAYVDPAKPLLPGRYCFVVMADDSAVIRRYLGADAKSFRLGTLNPVAESTVPHADIASIYRIVGSSES